MTPTIPPSAGPRSTTSEWVLEIELPLELRHGGIASCAWSSEPPGLGLAGQPIQPGDTSVRVLLTGGQAQVVYQVVALIAAVGGSRNPVVVEVPTVA